MVKSFLTQHKFVLFSLVLLSLVFFLTRLYQLTGLPIFTDEAIYLRWAQIAGQDPNWRFISLTDGKQPLFIWAMAVAMRVFSDPLFAGRLVSVFSGFAAMLGLFFLGNETFRNKWVGLGGSLLYVLYPLVLVHDRMALYDSMVGMFFVWSLLLTILLVRYVRLDLAFIFSLITGAGMLTKSSNFMSLALLPFSLLLFDWKKKERTDRLVKWVIFAGIGAVLSYLYYSVLRLSPFFHIIAEKNTTFVYPLREWILHPFTYVFGNFHGLFGWVIGYLTIPVCLLVLLSFFFRKYTLEKIFLFLVFLIPFTYASFFGKVLYPRYLLFMTLPLLLLASYSLVGIYQAIKNKGLARVVITVLLLSMAVMDIFILTDFAHSPIPKTDKDQYVNGWSAGNGVKEAVSYFREQAKNKKIFIGTEGTFGLMPFSLEMYLVKNPNITIKGYWPVTETPPAEVIAKSEEMPTYFLFYQPCPSCGPHYKAPASWSVEQVFRVKQGDSAGYLTVYALK